MVAPLACVTVVCYLLLIINQSRKTRSFKKKKPVPRQQRQSRVHLGFGQCSVADGLDAGKDAAERQEDGKQ
jgi:hypothetical protein